MKTMYKLIIKSYLGPMILTFFIVMFVLLMQFMWRYIDELVGKGLDMSVIFELMGYALASMVPMGLPLATLLASIMTMGDLGENNELLAMKCSGMSLPRIIKPLTIMIFIFSIASFFAVNNLVPYSWKKIYALIYDIRQQRQSLEFQDGIFFNGIPSMSIRVNRQDSKTGLMEDVLIYDTRDRRNNMMTTVADSGYISLSDDKNYILVNLFNGETYEENRGADWNTNSALKHYMFDTQKMVIAVDGFNMERSDEEMFNNQKTKSIRELTHDIDSIQNLVDQAVGSLNDQFLSNSLFIHNKEMAVDSLEQYRTEVVDLRDSIANLDQARRMQVVKNAMANASGAKAHINFDEATTKANVTQLYRYKTDWHKILSLPVSIMIFFLIGAPLGAIIRRGGLGMPIVISVTFYVIYYVISIFGEKLAKEGTWSAFAGTWLSTLVLIPFAIFITYKATNDSNLLNGDWYYHQLQKIKLFLKNTASKLKSKRHEQTTG